MPLLLISCVVLLAFASAAVADKVNVFAGGGNGGDGAAAQEATLNAPFAVGFDKSGNVYLAEMTGNRIRKIDAKGILTTLAGTGEKGDGGDEGPGIKATFNGPHSLVVAPSGDVYVADTWNNRVRKIDPKTGVISAFLGTGQKGFSGDGGPALKAQFGGIYCVALDPKGEQLYLADLDNRRIRAVDLKTGIVRTVAGNGDKGVPDDGADARSAPLVDPRAVAVDARGNVYILERGGNALRVVDAAGKIRTVAGTGQPGLSGDGGDARQATLNGPKHLCFDRDGNVLLADTENHVVRKYLPAEGKIVRVAGAGLKGDGGVGGAPEKIELMQPHGVAVDASGRIYLADSGNNRVLRIDKD